MREIITINVSDLSFYDESISNWNLEKGSYTIYVGNASDGVSEQINIKVK